MFNGIAVGLFPDVRLLTEHALPNPGDWRGDHFKTSDEANAAGWLRQLFLREEGDALIVGQAVPREWLAPGRKCGITGAATHFGQAGVVYTAAQNRITARLEAPRRNPPKTIRLRFRHPSGKPPASVTVNGRLWSSVQGDWVVIPGSVGLAVVVASWR
jgi:hypothetical protein